MIGDGAARNRDNDINIGKKVNAIACQNACIRKSRSDPSINGATYSRTGTKVCYCEKNMVRIDYSDKKWKTYYLRKSKILHVIHS